jgi:hypothetical protein
VQIGEFAQDFMEIRRDYRDWALPGYRAASRHSKSFSIASSFTENGDRPLSGDYSIHDRDSIAHESMEDYDIKKSPDGKDFTLELDIPSPYFELPRTPKNTHLRLGTPRNHHVKLAEAKGQVTDLVPSLPARYDSNNDYIKPPNLV